MQFRRLAIRVPGVAFQASLLAALAVVCFLTSWLNLYAYDDLYVVFYNPLVHTLAHWTRFFHSDYWAPFFHMGLYRPITILSFALEWTWRPSQPNIYHATNIALHALVVVLLFRFLRRWLSSSAAWVAAAWYAATPLHAGVVAGLVGRADLLAALFTLLALWAAEAGLSSQRWKWPAAVAVFPLTLLALGSKESAIVLSGLVVFLAWMESPIPQPLSSAALAQDLYARAAAGAALSPSAAISPNAASLTGSPPPAAVQDSRAGARSGFLSRLLLPFTRPVVWSAGLATICYLLVRIRVVGLMVHSTTFVSNPLAFSSTAARVRTALVNSAYVLRSLIWPFHLAPDYSYNQIPVVERWLSPRLGLALLLLAAAGVIAWLGRRNRACRLGYAWLALAWLPVSNLLFPIGAIYANRLLYLPSLGAALIIGAGWDAIWPRLKKIPWTAAVLAAAALALALVYARTDLRIGQYWSDNSSLFAYASRTAPNSSTVHFMYAGNLADWGHTRRAIAQFRQTLLIDPGYAAAWVGLGQLLARQKHLQAAAACFPHALAQLPRRWVYDDAAPIMLSAHHPGWLVRQAGVLDGKISAQERGWLRQAHTELAAHGRLAAAKAVK